MTSGPNTHTMESLLKNWQDRLVAVERRLARQGTGGGGSSIKAQAGLISPFAGGVVPNGWLIADGSAVSRATYPDLFTAIGTTYGAGDGSTTFNLPNMKGRFLVGRDGTQTEFDVLGETGGAKTHKHSVQGTAFVQMSWGAAGQIGMNRGTSPTTWNYDVMTTGSPAPVAANTTASTGGIEMIGDTETITELPPYIVTQWMISTGQGASGESPEALPPRLTASGAQVLDWNLVTEVGFYYSESTAINGPVSGIEFTGIIKKVNSGSLAGRVVQELSYPTVSTTNGLGQMQTWRRVLNGATGVWGDWYSTLDAVSLATIDLNAVVWGGKYIQNSSANATTARNYPNMGASQRAGHLDVSLNMFSTGADFVMQTYTEYAALSPLTVPRQWQRTNYNGTWTAWTEFNREPLPQPLRYHLGGTATISATAWGTAVPGVPAQTFTVVKPCWVMMTFGAWMTASAGETRAGVSLSGATTVTPPNNAQGTTVNSGVWGQTLLVQAGDVGATSGQRTMQRTFLLGTGTTTFTMEAYIITAGTHNVNYPVLEVVPLYYDGF